ncbi:HAMP domain-containing sensor histidine kinase [Crossiella sp. CA-258035]|uniref:sensor histidine kinase n=1 Tax=Crossiella sp. CA-258035 TaxID=2981138 RepID=UPI0024BCE979|nr:HAMP domain-containing sensor histidine kinase [Crossiella sp. CA-258035]WHT18483.1 HAMP domain-containing sensor histidine kinase [Crossiella sp. CA-258035]
MTGAEPRPLRTGSLRLRVSWASFGVFALAVIALIVLVDWRFGVQSTRELKDRMQARGDLVVSAARDYPRDNQYLAVKATGNGIRGTVVLPNGQEFHGPNLGELVDPVRVERQLPGKRKLIMVADRTETSAAQRRLRQLLTLLGVGTLLIAALVQALVIRLSLRPLDRMTSLARSIAGGHRGGRLAPTKRNTDMGRSAAAFDEMLDALEGAERQARESEERVRRFLADAAHELRTPLAGVQAAAEAVVQSSPETSFEERERLNVLMAREARRASRLVEDLLSIARIDEGLELRWEPVDLLALARSEAERIRLLANHVQVVVAGTPAVVSGDTDRLAQVLANLLGNARRYSERGGVVTVQVGQHGPWAYAEVADAGPGVPPADRERIFDRLVRLDSARDRGSGGAGLGLAIAQGIARAHGGNLECVEPPPGQPGALFRLLLPIRPAEL